MQPKTYWPYLPDPETTIRAVSDSEHAFICVAASRETEGGPSWRIGNASEQSILYAIGRARDYWPNATSFDVIGSDTRMEAARVQHLGLPPDAQLLRNPEVLLTLTFHPRA